MKALINPESAKEAKPVSLPGSKSHSNRALILAAASRTHIEFTGLSEAEDTLRMISALQALGFALQKRSGKYYFSPTAVAEKPVRLDAGDAGTVLRFLVALCSALPGIEVEIEGSRRLQERPIAPLIHALRELGADINAERLPLRIIGKRLSGGEIAVAGNLSSQFVSALLMVAPLMENPLTLKVTEDLVSDSYVSMTKEVMQAFGFVINQEAARKFRVQPQTTCHVQTFEIEADASAATYLAGLAALRGQTVLIRNFPADTVQGDAKFLQIMDSMGVQTRLLPHGLEISGGRHINSCTADLKSFPDSAPTLAVVAACALGKSTIHGLDTLEYKECRRVTAIVNELQKAGIQATAENNSITIIGGVPKSAAFHSYGDHRMAMALALFGAKVSVSVDNAESVSKSFPLYWETLGETGLVQVILDRKD